MPHRLPGLRSDHAQRRSLIYVGPDTARADDPRPALFTPDQVGDMAPAAGVQVNVLITGPDSAALTRSPATPPGSRSQPTPARPRR